MKTNLKNILKLSFITLIVLSKTFSFATEVLFSPSKNIEIKLQLIDKKLYYQAKFNNEKIINNSLLGLVFQENDSLVNFKSLKIEKSEYRGSWEPVWGQSDKIVENYNEISLLVNELNGSRQLKVVFRAYDDGFAFRYKFYDNDKIVNLMEELSQFNFSKNNNCWWIWADYNTLEKLYFNTKIAKAPHVAAPFTMQTPQGNFISVYEATLDRYSSMTILQNEKEKTNFRVNLVKWSDGVAVRVLDSLISPWRAVQLSSSAGGLMESSLILNLNEPAKEQNYSWIKPINYIGIWWEMHLGVTEWKLENNRHGATTENTKRYIDFAAKNGIDGVLIEGWNTGWEDWGKPDAFDFVTPYPDFDIYEITRYAKSKNIEIIGHHETGGDIVSYEKNLDRAFKFYKDLGIKYVKTGYAGPVNPPTEHHHGQYMVEHYNKVMRKAMEYNIILDVHEPIIPSGLARTYPNLMTFEGVRGMEWNAWSDGNPPSHTCILPFTRALAGPMDYTPGIFDIKLEKFKDKRVKWNDLDRGESSVHSTISNQIALMIILYSPMQMASDMIENYENHPAFEFIKNMPTTWNETKVLDAKIGEYVVVARRNNKKWYIAGITNEKARKINLNFDFLKDSKEYKFSLCSDGKKSHYEKRPHLYNITNGTISSNSKMQIRMAKGGGFIMIVEE